ncbi:hypothetical protein ACQBAU_04555 [Propionibacteriaceae bacterium Y2011]
MLEKYYHDLTDILGGDGVAQYPGLANIPAATWKIPALGGRLYGVAQPRPPAGILLFSRGDLLAENGINDPNVQLRDEADFVDLLDSLTDKSRDRFAMGGDPIGWLLSLVKQMCGVPNYWALRDGQFVHENETDEMKDAIDQAGRIIRAGHLHPNPFSDPGQGLTWFTAGVTSLYPQAFPSWETLAVQHPEWNVGNVDLPRWEGGGTAPVRKLPAGYGAFVAFKKSSDERIEQLLRVADFMASPFGTQEYLDVHYGVDGYSHTMENGVPTPVGGGPDVVLPMSYLGGNKTAVLYAGKDAERVRTQHEYLTRTITEGNDNAVYGLYPEAAVGKTAKLTAANNDVLREVMLGRKPMTEWDEFVSQWKSEAGDAMRAEYSEAAEKQ